MDILVIQLIVYIILFAATLFIPVGAPGTFLSAIAVLIWRLIEHGDTFLIRHFIIFLALAISGEVVEQMAGLFGARKQGASKWGIAGAFAGGIGGAVLGSMIVPVVGTIIGVFVGSFALTAVFEIACAKKTTPEGIKIGIGALIGKIVAVSYKYAVGIIMLVIIALRFWVK